MKARKLDLSDYQVPTSDGKSLPFKVRESVITLLFHADLRLNAVRLLEQNELAEKIRKAEGESILLETKEFSRVRDGLDCVTGLDQNAVEFVKRIVNAPEVEVEEKV